MPPEPNGRLVALEGPSAVGKTTLGRAVAAGSAWVLLPEAAALARPAIDLEFRSPSEFAQIERHLLAAERRRSRAATRLRAQGVDVLLDTSPLGPATYSLGVARGDSSYAPVAFEVIDTVVRDLREGRLVLPQEVVYLEATPATLRRRARAARDTHPERLVERHWTVAAIERAFWSTLAALDPKSVRFVSTVGPLTASAGRMTAALREPPTGLRLDAVVRELSDGRAGRAGPRNVTLKKGAPSRRPPRR
ncbi:MAG: AAA family ATPase [Thermoplasmata archaeon]|nr:AAA family ATPase [Thermoplasmata archaeon]